MLTLTLYRSSDAPPEPSSLTGHTHTGLGTSCGFAPQHGYSLSTATISPAYGSPPTQRNPLVDPPARPSQEGAMINSKMKPQPGEGGDCGRDKVVGP